MMRTLHRLSFSPAPNSQGSCGVFHSKPCEFLWCAIVISLAVLFLASCASADTQATQTAQAKRNALQATRQAELLQDTEQAKIAGVTATHQTHRTLTAQAELDQQATMDADAATEQAYAAQSTAEALELQQFIESARNWPGVVVDLFDQPVYEWPTSSETFSGGSITWSIEEGKYRWTASANRGFAYWIYPIQQPVGDFYLAVEVEHASGTSDSEAGLIFHVNERDYWCYLISGEGDLFIGLRINGEWQLSWPMGSSHIYSGKPNQLAVVSQNNYYLFLINGYSFMSIGEDALPAGPAGLMINLWNAGDQAAWDFDNFELRTPGTPIPLSTPVP